MVQVYGRFSRDALSLSQNSMICYIFLIKVRNTTSMPLLCLQWAAQSILSYSNNFSTGTRERSDLKNHDPQNPVHPHEDDEVLRSAEKNALIQENDLSACASKIERSVSRLLIS